MRYLSEKILLFVLILILILINYNFVDNFIQGKIIEDAEFVQIERVVDGDTVVINGSYGRLLGINCPEKGEMYSSEATKFLEGKVLNKTLEVERYGKDRYGRDLIYLFDGKENINLEIVRLGYGNFYFPDGLDKYYWDFYEAWEECLENLGERLCTDSMDGCKSCVEVEEWGYNKNTILYNKCGVNCNLDGWSVKDEGRKKYVFVGGILHSGERIELYPEDFYGSPEYVWTRTGDSIFLRDGKNRLVFWDSYII